MLLSAAPEVQRMRQTDIQHQNFKCSISPKLIPQCGALRGLLVDGNGGPCAQLRSRHCVLCCWPIMASLDDGSGSHPLGIAAAKQHFGHSVVCNQAGQWRSFCSKPWLCLTDAR